MVNETESAVVKKGKDGGGLIKIISVFFAVLAPLFYMAGKVYYEGYLFYFHLKPSMFPMDVYETFSTAAMALIYASLEGLNGAQRIFEKHCQALVVLFLLLVFSLLLYRFFVRRMMSRLNAWRPAYRWSPRVLFCIEEFFKCFAWVFMPFYILFFCMFAVAFLLFLILAPFDSVGKQQAERDLRGEFKNSPLVGVLGPEGDFARYRLMECSSSFCALYAKGLVVTVPVSDVKWGVSDVREKTNSYRCWKAAELEQRLVNKSVYVVSPKVWGVRPSAVYFLYFPSLSRLADHCKKVDRLSVI